MTNEERILSLLTSMQEDMSGMKEDMSSMKEDMSSMKEDIETLKADMASVKSRLDALEEAHEETRNGVNRLLGWADECGYVVKFPLPKLN